MLFEQTYHHLLLLKNKQQRGEFTQERTQQKINKPLSTTTSNDHGWTTVNSGSDGSEHDKERTTADRVPHNSIFAQSVVEQVLHSWELIAVNKEAVGMDVLPAGLL